MSSPLCPASESSASDPVVKPAANFMSVIKTLAATEAIAARRFRRALASF